jgi:hypothetical protein
MKPSLIRKAELIAKECAPAPRLRFFWWEQDETREAAEARMRASIASGETSPNDRCYLFTWTRPESEGADVAEPRSSPLPACGEAPGEGPLRESELVEVSPHPTGTGSSPDISH